MAGRRVRWRFQPTGRRCIALGLSAGSDGGAGG